MGLASCQFSFLKRFWFWSDLGAVNVVIILGLEEITRFDECLE